MQMLRLTPDQSNNILSADTMQCVVSLDCSSSYDSTSVNMTTAFADCAMQRRFLVSKSGSERDSSCFSCMKDNR